MKKKHQKPTDNKHKKTFYVKGTVCSSCSEIIKRSALKIPGVKDIDFDQSTEKATVVFDKNTTIKEICSAIEEKGYSCEFTNKSTEKQTHKNMKKQDNSYTIGWIASIIGILILGYFILNLTEGIHIPQITQNMGYGLLFLVGLLTGFHCIAMCGGFVVSYTTKNAQKGVKSHKSHLMYGTGKVISYSVIGAAFGFLGSIIAFTPLMRGIAGVLAGIFLVLFGVKMLNIFPALRKFQIRMPKAITKFVGTESRKNSSPLVIGLLNGLMIACGPLQAIYVMAAGTGSMIEGAKMLFVFGIGTLPVMLGFGYITSLISSKATRSILKTSGVVVIVLGLIMVNRGLALTGTGYDANSLISGFDIKNQNTQEEQSYAKNSATLLNNGIQEIRMDVTRYGWEPDKFVLKKGVPVRWVINGKEINGCNNAIQVPKLGLEFDIKQGKQIIEFTPTEEGVLPWSCWMGMIPGTFIVRENIDIDNKEQVKQELEDYSTTNTQPAAGTCGGSCGSPTCGSATGGGCGCGMG